MCVLLRLGVCVCGANSWSLPVSSTVPTLNPEAEELPALPASSALEEMALYSNKRKLRQGRRSLETAVPT